MFCNWFGNLEERIKKLGQTPNPPRGLRELDDYKELDDRIKKLEENNNASTSKTTTVKSTALDFDSIKNNLKTFLANKDEFKDYNFELSGLRIS